MNLLFRQAEQFFQPYIKYEINIKKNIKDAW